MAPRYIKVMVGLAVEDFSILHSKTVPWLSPYHFRFRTPTLTPYVHMNPYINYANILLGIYYSMVKNLDEEYISKQIIYEQQKEYRKTPEGKLALRRAKERQTLKQIRIIKKSHGGGLLPKCVECGDSRFEVLVVNYNVVICYNCKFERPKVLTEEEICQ